MDPDHIGAWSVSTMFVIEASQTFSRQEKYTTFVVIGALRVKEAG